MNRLSLPLLSLGAALLAAPIFAQSVMPAPDEVAALQAVSEIGHARAAAGTPLTVNVNSREETRQFYRAVYGASENISSGWTGSYATGASGTTTAAFKDAVLLRTNFYRALTGVPATVVFNSTFSAKAQQAALMMSANNQLQHTGIPTSWTFYTADGAEAAAKSNLDLGRSGPASIDAYMNDFGTGNTGVPHRRWVLYPQTLEMGTGDVPGNSSFLASNALWVQDANIFGTRPATRNEFVAFPAPGYAPYPIVAPRWSFSYPAADFSTATVSVTRAGVSVPLTLEPVGTGFGENTLVWVMDNLDSNANIAFARPTADTVYSVAVNNVRINNVARNFSYNVTVFDPGVPGADFSAVTVSGPATTSVGTASSYTIAKPAFVGTFEWRYLQLGAYSKNYGAESGLEGITATTSAGYNVVQSTTVGAGASSYRLGHVTIRSTQSLLLPESFYITGSNSSLTFLSRLGIATAIEVAHAQVSTDDGISWGDVFSQIGASPVAAPTANDAAFVARNISLAAYVGRTVRVRFAFTIDPTGTAFLPNETNTVGWFLDNIAVTGVQSVTPGAVASVASGTNFSFTPPVSGTLALQARGVLFGAYPMEWGSVTSITATETGSSSRITNLSVLSTLSGGNDSFTLGYVVGNSSAANPLSLLIRAAGPSLGALGVGGTLADPKLETFAGPTKTGENDNWGGTSTLKSAFTAVGAFAFAGDNTKDSASLASIITRDNSVKVSAADNGAGAVIAEVYDATPTANFSANTPRLVNVSVLKPIGSSLTVGFVIGGTGSKRILIRALGPTLSTLFGFPAASVIADPKLELFNGASQSIGTNDNWGGTTELTTAFTASGTFSFAANSLDAALVTTLAPGLYTVQVTPAAGATGTGLVEVYEVP